MKIHVVNDGRDQQAETALTVDPYNMTMQNWRALR